ncbi:hypothetical protein [Sphingomonas sp.]|uniref:hypothetical protein n=1 Tax=Sphingomonas sp. TaxID=28214 RepID=UPI0017F30786|nr:hypothetical protein [Sphingomonas sp.]MBA3512453.1 hypothetical protein [Sphingomonas sp.]
MMDEHFDRTYQSGRAELNAGIDRGLRQVAANFARSLDVLHRIQWSAPWAAKSARDPGCA